MRKVKEILLKIVQIKTLILALAVNLCLFYFASKYYIDGELYFNTHQYQIFLCFVLANFWMFLYLLHQNTLLKNDNIVIKDLIQILFDERPQLMTEISKIKSDNIKLHRNTQELLITFLSNREEDIATEDTGEKKYGECTTMQ